MHLSIYVYIGIEIQKQKTNKQKKHLVETLATSSHRTGSIFLFTYTAWLPDFQFECKLHVSHGFPQDWEGRWPKAKRWPYYHQTPLHVSFTPAVVESDFVKYEGKFQNQLSGSIETALGKVKLSIGGKGLVERQSSFGTLRKQEVDLQQLMRDSTHR